jgi:hypothetical protein
LRANVYVLLRLCKIKMKCAFPGAKLIRCTHSEMSGYEGPEYVVVTIHSKVILVDYKASKIELRYALYILVYTAVCNIQRIYILPTKWIYVFCMDLRTKSSHFSM